MSMMDPAFVREDRARRVALSGVAANRVGIKSDSAESLLEGR